MHLYASLWPWTWSIAGFGQSLFLAWNQHTGTRTGTRKYDLPSYIPVLVHWFQITSGDCPNRTKRFFVQNINLTWTGNIFRAMKCWDLRICAKWRPAAFASNPALSKTDESGFWEEIAAAQKLLIQKCLWFEKTCFFLLQGRKSWFKTKKIKKGKIKRRNTAKWIFRTARDDPDVDHDA